MLIFNFFPVCAHNDFCSLRSMCIFALKLFCLPLLVEFSTFYLSYILSFGGIVKKLSVSTFDNLIGAFNCSTWLFSNGTLIKLFALIIESKLLFKWTSKSFLLMASTTDTLHTIMTTCLHAINTFFVYHCSIVIGWKNIWSDVDYLEDFFIVLR